MGNYRVIFCLIFEGHGIAGEVEKDVDKMCLLFCVLWWWWW